MKSLENTPDSIKRGKRDSLGVQKSIQTKMSSLDKEIDTLRKEMK